MIKTKYFYKYPYKEPPVLIMDMHAHLVRSGSSLIYYTRRIEEPLFRGILKERDKKYVTYSIAGEGRSQ